MAILRGEDVAPTKLAHVKWWQVVVLLQLRLRPVLLDELVYTLLSVSALFKFEVLEDLLLSRFDFSWYYHIIVLSDNYGTEAGIPWSLYLRVGLLLTQVDKGHA